MADESVYQYPINATKSDKDNLVFRTNVLLLFASIMGVALISASYVHAHHNADALMSRRSIRWCSYPCQFSPIRGITGHWGPCWDFSYEPADYNATVRTTLDVTMLGEVVASNPLHTLSKLSALPRNNTNEVIQLRDAQRIDQNGYELK